MRNTGRSWKVITLFWLLMLALSVPALAEDLFSRYSCNEFGSGKSFVKKAVVGCLQTRESRKCERQAENFFMQCGYEGQYREISAKVHSDLLVLIVLQGTPSLKSSGERKKL